MPLVKSQRVVGTSTTSSGFCSPQTNVRPAVGSHDGAGACAFSSWEPTSEIDRSASASSGFIERDCKPNLACPGSRAGSASAPRPAGRTSRVRPVEKRAFSRVCIGTDCATSWRVQTLMRTALAAALAALTLYAGARGHAQDAGVPDLVSRASRYVEEYE